MEIKHLENIDFWHMYRSLRKSNNLQYSFAMDWGEESVDKTRAQLLLVGMTEHVVIVNGGYKWAVTCFLMIIDTNCTQGCCES